MLIFPVKLRVTSSLWHPNNNMYKYTLFIHSTTNHEHVVIPSHLRTSSDITLSSVRFTLCITFTPKSHRERNLLLKAEPTSHHTNKNITAHKTSTRCFVSIIPPVFSRPPRAPAPPTPLHTFSVTPALGIKDPSTISLTAFTSERGSIMEQLERE